MHTDGSLDALVPLLLVIADSRVKQKVKEPGLPSRPPEQRACQGIPSTALDGMRAWGLLTGKGKQAFGGE